MNVSDFNYEHPKELIAQQPCEKRDAARMMVVDRGARTWKHRGVIDLPELLEPGDLLVLNDSRVIPARLFGTNHSGLPIELLVVEPGQGPGVWRCLIQKAKRLRRGDRFHFGMHAVAEVTGHEAPYLLVRFRPDALELAMKHHGVPPLPPYIEREGFEAYSAQDRERYQTTFARTPGSAAAPTAGLHLSERLLERITARGVEMAQITLHVGIDTFTPVRAETTEDHRMHGERVEVPIETVEAVAKAKREGRRVIAVGTTTTRALESACHTGHGSRVTGHEDGDHDSHPRIHFGDKDSTAMKYGSWVTDLFITPGFEFQVVDAMLTNFHIPKSTLLMMVSAFADRAFILECYAEAVRERYRLFSYGDCMLIE